MVSMNFAYGEKKLKFIYSTAIGLVGILLTKSL